MPYEIKGKCIYKKDGGAKVGCTKGDVHKYLAALHANANESIDKSNILKGGKADKIKNLDDLFNYWATIGYKKGGVSKSLRKQLEYEIKIGLKVEAEHTDSPEKQLEIVLDHLVEDKEYYTKPKPKDWGEQEIDTEKLTENKLLIKKILRNKLFN